jgi:hypothetical protein
MQNFEVGVGCSQGTSGCSQSTCDSLPDFCIKRGDSRPSFKVLIQDCEGVVDLTDENLVLEASMWFKTKLKSSIEVSDDHISFADNIGFDQVSVGDVIVMDRVRSPERMLVVSIDESNKTVEVERGYDSTVVSGWPKGNVLRSFRFMDQQASIESAFEEVASVDGNSAEELVETFMVFEWTPSHTSLPGCYFFEFKLTMMDASSVSWVKKTPLDKEGFVINIVDSPNNS